MGHALLFPEPDKRGRGNKGKSSETDGFSSTRLKVARAEAVFVAFDLIERDGEDLRDLPLIERKRRLARLISKRRTGGRSSTASI